MLRLVLFSCCVVLCVGHRDCGLNEETKCVYPCPPEKSCRNRDISFSCLQVVENCQETCVCKEGFLRNDVGQCKTIEECDTCQGDNEFFECGGACDNECDTLDTQNRTNCPIMNIICNRKCYCKDGFARDNENNCIPIEKCHTCQGENEFFDCGSACDNVCDTLDTQNRTKCPIASFVCNPKCYCKDGFARDSENKCIPVEKCHSQNVEGSKISEDGTRARRYSDIAETICTGENEVYSDCKKSCPPDVCLSIAASYICDSKEPCKKGCVCKPGYLRLDLDTPCIITCQCPQMQGNPDCERHDYY